MSGKRGTTEWRSRRRPNPRPPPYLVNVVGLDLPHGLLGAVQDRLDVTQLLGERGNTVQQQEYILAPIRLKCYRTGFSSAVSLQKHDERVGGFRSLPGLAKSEEGGGVEIRAGWPM